MIGITMSVTDEEKRWMDEHYYLPYEIIRDYNNDSFFEDGNSVWIHGESLGWDFILFVYEDIMLSLSKNRKEKLIFDEMMDEGTKIRANVVTANKPQGWGRKVSNYKPKGVYDRPHRKFSDGPIIYKGNIITKEEAEIINKKLNEYV